MGRAALVIVDVQRGFIVPDVEPLPPAIAAYVDAHRDRYAAIIATRFRNRPGSRYVSERDWDAMIGDEETQLLPAIAAAAGHVIDKHGLAPDRGALGTLLLDAGVERVHLCGLDTDQCVLATALLLWDAGFAPAVLADLCASSGGTALHDAALAILRRAIGDRNVVRSSDLRPDLDPTADLEAPLREVARQAEEMARS
ncbi:MAG: isochorismatase family cysteine hydrolase [Chloroflexota bacterium]